MKEIMYVSVTNFGGSVEINGIGVPVGTTATVSIEPSTAGRVVDYDVVLTLDRLYGVQSMYLDISFEYDYIEVKGLVFRNGSSFRVRFEKGFSIQVNDDSQLEVEELDELNEDDIEEVEEEVEILGMKIVRRLSACTVEL